MVPHLLGHLGKVVNFEQTNGLLFLESVIVGWPDSYGLDRHDWFELEVEAPLMRQRRFVARV